MNKKKEIIKIESKKDQSEKKRIGTHFVIRKNIFSLLLFVGWSFGFAFQK
jgi:hypothetical protein